MHWTYDKFEPESELEQGDILAPNEELRSVLAGTHPRSSDENTMGFMVATQSCDLAIREGVPDAEHISIVPVLSLKSVFPQLLTSVGAPAAPGLFPAGSKLEAKRFLKRIFDQNEQKLGLFYLHPDAEIGLAEPSVAFLRVKLALAATHYDVLRRARVGRLHTEFRPKFGWLLGNLYARAASPDWKDKPEGGRQLNELIKKHLEEQIPGAGPAWVDDELIEAGRERGIAFEGRSRESLLAELETLRPKPRLQRVVEAALAEVESLLHPEQEQVTKLRNRLSNKLGNLVGR